jgi:hypothetical protein
MSAGSWVAGSVRSQAMARRRLGTSGIRTLAQCGSLTAATQILEASPYGRTLRVPAGVAEAQHAVLDAVLWNLRVLAGWLPDEGVRSLRLLSGWFEIANVDEHLAQLTGRAGEPPYHLGVLASAWPRLERTGSVAELRSTLAESVWGDPGGDTARDITLWMRITWARRVVEGVPQARPWALGATALLVAAQIYGAGRPLPERVAWGVERVLGREWAGADSLASLRERLPFKARWVLQGVDHPAQLWQAEAAWWRRLRRDGLKLLDGRFGPARPIGAVALLAADAWQVRAALELAARPPTEEEVLDVVA